MEVFKFKTKPNLEQLSNILINNEAELDSQKVELYSLIGSDIVENFVKSKLSYK